MARNGYESGKQRPVVQPKTSRLLKLNEDEMFDPAPLLTGRRYLLFRRHSSSFRLWDLGIPGDLIREKPHLVAELQDSNISDRKVVHSGEHVC